MAICEICGKQAPKDEIYSRTRDDGQGKNKGECNACAKELDAMLQAAVAKVEGYKIQVKGDVAINTVAPNMEALIAMLRDQLEGLEPGSVIKLTITKGAK